MTETIDLPDEIVRATDAPPPTERLTPRQWVREHLLGSWYDALLTLAFAALFIWGAVSLVGWLIEQDFTILRQNLALFLVGRFPAHTDQLWRLWVATGLLAILIGFLGGIATASARDSAAEAGLSFRPSTPRDWLRRFWPLLILVGVLLSLTRTPLPAILTLGAVVLGIGSYYAARGLPKALRRWGWLIAIGLVVAVYLALAAFGGVGWSDWSGYHLTLFLTVGGLLFAFPIGLLAALGRRSRLPAIRTISIAYIEFVRGVPLITLLFMGVFALRFMLPRSIAPSDVTRVLVAIALFEGAYIAEVVRGGLQGVPGGQVEAAQALGLRPTTTLRRIVLPQALRNTIPAMVGQFISLYKDTSLVAFVGLIDLLRVSNIVNSQPAYVGRLLAGVTLPFVGLIYWVVSYTMSREGRRLERKLGVGER